MFGFKKKNRKILVDQEISEHINVSERKIDMKKNYISEVLKDKKLPIVLLDPLWHSAREQINSEIISRDEKKLQELLKEQGKLNNDYKDYTTVKQNFLKQILEVSEAVQGSGNEKKLDELNKLHQSTLTTNEKLEQIENRLEKVEKEIESVNRELIEEMIAVGYEYIDVCKNKSRDLEEEIASLRQQMLIKTEEKKKSDKLFKDIYNYLHSVVGQEHIEVVDKSMGDN